MMTTDEYRSHWGERTRKLTDAAHAYGECDLYVGDDGLIYCPGGEGA